jgi:hypothetical protein
MQETNKYTTEQGLEKALAMYKENVSPSEISLQKILSQIPEQKTHEEGRAVRSPYTWLAITQIVMLCSIMIAVFPTLSQPSYMNDQFYEIDSQVQAFDASIDAQDAADTASMMSAADNQ